MGCWVLSVIKNDNYRNYVIIVITVMSVIRNVCRFWPVRFSVHNEVKGKDKRILHAFRKIVLALSVASLYSLCA